MTDLKRRVLELGVLVDEMEAARQELRERAFKGTGIGSQDDDRVMCSSNGEGIEIANFGLFNYSKGVDKLIQKYVDYGLRVLSRRVNTITIEMNRKMDLSEERQAS